MKTVLSFFILAGLAAQAFACDLCGCYLPQMQRQPMRDAGGLIWLDGPTAGARAGQGVYGAVAEQFTHFGTVQVDGRRVDNPSGQRAESSITQLVAGYAFNERFGLQVNVPFIYRSYKRPAGFATERGSEAGLGDVSLLGKLLVFKKETGVFSASAGLFAGWKGPTGDSSRLKEEFNEVEVEGAPASGIHGHDLALGTGSWDGVFGGQVSVRYGRVFFEGGAQYTVRGGSHYGYQFADDFSWSGGPGCYLVQRAEAALGVQFVVAGEHKDTDTFQGREAEDTGLTSVYLGPRVLLSLGRVSGEIGADFPAWLDNTALQVVPDYRLRAAVTVGF